MDLELGAFSVSLSVKDLAVSMDFYRKLGFEVTGGDEESWAIMVNGRTVIGLFHGMFEGNILTFNPGWTGPGEAAESFTDVRQLRAAVESQGIEVVADTNADEPSGPASFSIVDPDGNAILIDQHV